MRTKCIIRFLFNKQKRGKINKAKVGQERVLEQQHGIEDRRVHICRKVKAHLREDVSHL